MVIKEKFMTMVADGDNNNNDDNDDDEEEDSEELRLNKNLKLRITSIRPCEFRLSKCQLS